MGYLKAQYCGLIKQKTSKRKLLPPNNKTELCPFAVPQWDLTRMKNSYMYLMEGSNEAVNKVCILCKTLFILFRWTELGVGESPNPDTQIYHCGQVHIRC